MSLCVLVWFVLTQQFGLVGGPVCLQVLSVLSDVRPGPHVTEASDVDLHDAVEGVLPPGKDTQNIYTKNSAQIYLKHQKTSKSQCHNWLILVKIKAIPKES